MYYDDEPIMRPYDEKEIILLVDSHHGIYCWQILADDYNLINATQEDIDILLAGPDHEFYIEAILHIEQNAFVSIGGNLYGIFEMDGDIMGIPEDMAWP